MKNSTNVVCHDALYMGLELGNHLSDGMQVAQSQHGSDLRTYLAEDLLNAWNHCHFTIDQSAKQTKIVALSEGRMQKLEVFFARIKLYLIVTTPVMSALLCFSPATSVADRSPWTGAGALLLPLL